MTPTTNPTPNVDPVPTSQARRGTPGGGLTGASTIAIGVGGSILWGVGVHKACRLPSTHPLVWDSTRKVTNEGGKEEGMDIQARVLYPAGWKRVRGGVLLPGDRILDIREDGQPMWYTVESPCRLSIKSTFPGRLIIRRKPNTVTR
jgi:hypothetical protein